ncbi:MAG: hypothetical protein HXY18_00810 [Bryobacteraceae bacterium]|nr:hypothetical protein [Bryobacteraceae bacterium]
MLDDLWMLFRFTRGLVPFLTELQDAQGASEILAEGRARRVENFLALLRRAVFEYPARPYSRLFHHAGFDFGKTERLVLQLGIEAALERLLDAGVYLTLDEFKGRVPIRRGGVEIAATASDFDNPLLKRDFEAATSGSTGTRRRLLIDLDLLRFEAALQAVFIGGAGMAGMPMGIWRPVPPGTAGIKRALSQLRYGERLERWFTMEPFSLVRPRTKSWAVTAAALGASRLAGRPLPVPEFVPLENAIVVAEWMASVLRRGERPYLDASSSAAVRVIQAARAAGFNLRGSFVRVGSEPFTPARAALFEAAGCGTGSNYSISETGVVAIACSRPAAPDDAHLIDAKIAILQREGVPLVRAQHGTVPIFLTTLLTSTPKLLINVESGDFADRSERRCGCVFDRLGFTTHLQNIRSYEKLTTEGMHFTGSTLLRIVEEVLPARFGGDPTDYQLAEAEVEGNRVVRIRMHPRLGDVAEEEVVGAVLSSLAAEGAGDRMMADIWRQAKTLRLERRPPEVSAAGKVPAVVQARDAG